MQFMQEHTIPFILYWHVPEHSKVTSSRFLLFHNVLIIRPNTTIRFQCISLLLHATAYLGCPHQPLSSRWWIHTKNMKGEPKRVVVYDKRLIHQWFMIVFGRITNTLTYLNKFLGLRRRVNICICVDFSCSLHWNGLDWRYVAQDSLLDHGEEHTQGWSPKSQPQPQMKLLKVFPA